MKLYLYQKKGGGGGGVGSFSHAERGTKSVEVVLT